MSWVASPLGMALTGLLCVLAMGQDRPFGSVLCSFVIILI